MPTPVYRSKQERLTAELVFRAIRQFHEMGGMFRLDEQDGEIFASVWYSEEMRLALVPILHVLKENRGELVRQLTNFAEMRCGSACVQ